MCKEQFKKRISCALLLLILLLPSYSVYASAPDENQNVRVGFFDFAGYHETDLMGNRSGYGYEYLHEMAKSTGWNFTYVAGTWEECQAMLKNGEIDLLTSAQFTPERAEYFDFSQLPIGQSYAQITVLSDNQYYTRNDYAGFNGMNIGILEGNSRNTFLEIFAAEKGFSYESVLFDSADALNNALQNGTVDAILTSSLRKLSNERIISQFAPSPFYCIVKKGNTKLLSEVNAALADIEMSNPAYKFELYEKYYRSDLTQGFCLTTAEADCLKENHTLRVVGNPVAYPLSYYQSGSLKGIASDVLKLVTDNLMIELEYVQADTYEQAIKMLRDGEADIINMIETDYNYAEQQGIRMTSPYTVINYSAITRTLFSGDFDTIAVVEGSYIDEVYIESTYKNAVSVSFKTAEDAVRAVAKKDVDVAFVDTYSAQSILTQDYQNLKSTFIDGQSASLSFGVSKNVPHTLYTILNRKVNSLDRALISEIIANHTMLQKYHYSLLQYAKQNPIAAISILSSLFLSCILVMLYIMTVNKKHAKRTFDLAYRDKMTGLWNANGFILQVMKQAPRTGNMSGNSIVVMDIQGFSSVNNDYGRVTGDMAIIEIARQLKRCCGENAVVSHANADNFTLWLTYESQKELELILNGICSSMQVFTLNDYLLKLNFRIGVCPAEISDELSLYVFLEHAQTAHQIAKKKSMPIVYYDTELEAQIKYEKMIIDHVEPALASGEFKVYYQAKYDIRSHTIVGAEALIRWEHKELGFLTPGNFIPLLEGTGDVVEIDFYVLEEVCKLIRHWIDTGQPVIQLSVNQSRAHFKNPNYIDRLQDLLIKYDISRDIIELEITESLFESQNVSQEIIKKIKMLGFLISIDDFGSGYSSLYLLNQVSIDILKIDRCLITDSESKIKVRKILRKIVEMAYDIGLDVICEGVENQDQANYLMEIGCKHAQGFLYSKPVPQEDFLKLLLI